MSNFKYSIKPGRPINRFINAQGIQVATTEKDITVMQPKTSKVAEHERVIPAATQEDLEFGFEKLGLKDLIAKVEETKPVKNDTNGSGKVLDAGKDLGGK